MRGIAEAISHFSKTMAGWQRRAGYRKRHLTCLFPGERLGQESKAVLLGEIGISSQVTKVGKDRLIS